MHGPSSVLRLLLTTFRNGQNKIRCLPGIFLAKSFHFRPARPPLSPKRECPETKLTLPFLNQPFPMLSDDGFTHVY